MTLDASMQDGTAVQSKEGMPWGEMATTTHKNVPVWDLNAAQMTKSGGADFTIPEKYTAIQWVWLRKDGGDWRTFLRTSADHIGLVQDGTQELGMWSNQEGQWRGTGMKVEYDKDWAYIVQVGVKNGANQWNGTTTHYLADSKTFGEATGTSDRVATGSTMNAYGWGTQAPGYVAQVWFWNRDLSKDEVKAWWQQTKGRYSPDPEITMDASKQDGNAVQSKEGMQWGELATTKYEGVDVWDLNEATLLKSGGPDVTVGKKYTAIQWLWLRKSNVGWRTFFRPTSHHIGLVQDGTTALGEFANGAGDFRPSG